MEKKKLIALLLCLLLGARYPIFPQTASAQIEESGSWDISVMWSRPDVAEQYACKIVQANVPNPDSSKFNYLKAQYLPLYKAYGVICHYTTEDAYGILRDYKIRMKIKILPDNQGGLNYDVYDLEELK